MMREDDYRFIEEQLARLDMPAPPKQPILDEVFAGLVRIEKLWTAREYAYIQHFHKVYGFDEHSDLLRGEIAYDEWMYWHITAVQRYQMDPGDLAAQLATVPPTRPKVWRFEIIPDLDESKKGLRKVCIPWGNYVPYDVASIKARGWGYVTILFNEGIVWKLDAPYPHSIFALMQFDPKVTILFSGPDSFEKLTYYLGHATAIRKRFKVRPIDASLDYHFHEPDAGYSYRWEDGSLLPDGYMAGFLRYQQEQKNTSTERESAEDDTK